MKIGIFGGTFNPIHVGHAIIANYVIHHCGIDKLWLMVSPLNPFKVQQGEVNDEHRLRMASMVSSKLENVETSAFEFTLPRPSYTVDTLNALSQKFPDDEFYLIIGADNWEVFDRWCGHEELLEKYHVMIYPREGYNIEIPAKYKHHATEIGAPVVEVSSTVIRDELRQLNNMCFYLPDDVYRYILNHKLYLE